MQANLPLSSMHGSSACARCSDATAANTASNAKIFRNAIRLPCPFSPKRKVQADVGACTSPKAGTFLPRVRFPQSKVGVSSDDNAALPMALLNLIDGELAYGALPLL